MHTANNEIASIHAAAVECLACLDHLAILIENWPRMTGGDRESAAKGMRTAIEGLVPAFWRRPPADSSGRLAMIRSAAASGTATVRLENEIGASVHDAVFSVANQVLNWVAVIIGWKEWLRADAGNPPPTAIDLSWLDARGADAIIKMLSMCTQITPAELRAARPRLDVEYAVATERLPTEVSPTNGPKRKRHRASGKIQPLTAKQLEAVQIVGECRGNIAEAAKRLGKARKTVEQHYKTGMEKLGASAPRHGTQRLPADRRGQENLCAADDRRNL